MYFSPLNVRLSRVDLHYISLKDDSNYYKTHDRTLICIQASFMPNSKMDSALKYNGIIFYSQLLFALF